MQPLDSLSEYGTTFQLKVLTNILKGGIGQKDTNDSSFLIQIIDILEPELFDDEANRFIVECILKYYKGYRQVIPAQVLAVESKKIDEALSVNVRKNLKTIYSYISSNDLEYIKNEFLEYAKVNIMKRAILSSVDKFKVKDYDGIFSSIKQAMNFGNFYDEGHLYENMVDQRLSSLNRANLIPTPWGSVNTITSGGLGAGDLGIVVGGAGSGKSWALTNLGLHAMKLGKKVLHYTLELKENYTAIRYDSCIMQMTADDLKYHIEDIKLKLYEIPGTLRIKNYPTKGATVNTLRADIEKRILHGFSPDLIIIDYADLLRSDNLYAMKGGSYHESGAIYEEIRGLAGEFNVVIWTASQANRGASNNDILTGEDIAESYKKVMTGDFVISISRKVEDKLTETARWHVIKNRYGVDGITMPSTMNLSIGKIEIFEQNSYMGIKATKTMESGEKAVKQKIRDSISQLAHINAEQPQRVKSDFE